jgi:Tol biopolymer transport system component
MNGSTRMRRYENWTSFLPVIMVTAVLMSCSSGEKPYTMGESKGSAAETRGPEEWKIAFNSDRDGNYEVYLVSADGSNPQNLTANEATDWVYYARERIVFASDRDREYRQGDYDLYTIDPVGVLTERLTRFPVYDSYVSASPDGRRFVVCSRKDGNSEIYIIDGEGNEETRLTDNEFEDRDPCWSPGGFRIAFRSNREGPWDIWLMNVDGSNLRKLTDHAGNDELHGYQEGPPHWSPDGKTILFSSEREGNFDLYVVRPDGWELDNLTNTPANEVWAAWSPDGKKIVFDSDRDGNHEIYVMNADGSGVQRITDNPAADHGPVWVGR